jgi:hypothetical protein
MSIKIMSQVWELDLPHNAQSIFLALADHADDDGYCYPSVARLAWKTGYGVRQVQRTLKDLRDQKLAIPTGSVAGGRHNTVVYRLDPFAGNQKPPFQPKTERQTLADIKGANLTPFDGDSEIKGDTQDAERVTFETQRVTSKTLKGDIAMSPESSVTIKESSIEPSGETSDLPSDPPPDWFQVLSGLPKFQTSLADAKAWLSKKSISADLAETTAYGVQSFISQPKNKGRDPWATFQNWARKDKDAVSPQSRPPPKIWVNSIDYVAMEAEQDARKARGNQ